MLPESQIGVVASYMQQATGNSRKCWYLMQTLSKLQNILISVIHNIVALTLCGGKKHTLISSYSVNYIKDLFGKTLLNGLIYSLIK